MPLYTAHCSQCNYVARARTRTALLHKIRTHLWKKHRNWMISRIKAGKRRSADNPADLEMIKAIQSGARDALKAYYRMTERQFQKIKKTMRALQPILPTETILVWKFIEAVHELKEE